MKSYNINRGFSLIELIIVMAIIAILSVIVYDNYSKQAQANRRTEAKNMLFEIMQREEKYMSENNTYTTDLTDLGYEASPLDTDNGFYSISAEAGSDGITDSVVLTATAQAVQENDETCGNLILNSNGRKTTSTDEAEYCW